LHTAFICPGHLGFQDDPVIPQASLCFDSQAARTTSPRWSVLSLSLQRYLGGQGRRRNVGVQLNPASRWSCPEASVYPLHIWFSSFMGRINGCFALGVFGSSEHVHHKEYDIHCSTGVHFYNHEQRRNRKQRKKRLQNFLVYEAAQNILARNTGTSDKGLPKRDIISSERRWWQHL